MTYINNPMTPVAIVIVDPLLSAIFYPLLSVATMQSHRPSLADQVSDRLAGRCQFHWTTVVGVKGFVD